MTNLLASYQAMNLLRRDLEDVLEQLPIPLRMRREAEELIDAAPSPAWLWRAIDQMLEDYMPPAIVRRRIERAFDRAFTTFRGGYAADGFSRGGRLDAFGRGYGEGSFRQTGDWFGRTNVNDGWSRSFDGRHGTFGAFAGQNAHWPTNGSFFANGHFPTNSAFFANGHFPTNSGFFANGHFPTNNGFFANGQFPTNNGFFANGHFPTNNGFFANGQFPTNNGAFFANGHFPTNNGFFPTSSFSSMNGGFPNNGIFSTNPFFSTNGFGTNGIFSTNEQTIPVEVIEREHDIVVRAEIPAREHDVDTRITGDNVLTIRAQLVTGNIVTRTIPLPRNVDVNRVQAVFQRGVLEVCVLKFDSTRGHRVPVQRETGFRTNVGDVRSYVS